MVKYKRRSTGSIGCSILLSVLLSVLIIAIAAASFAFLVNKQFTPIHVTTVISMTILAAAGFGGMITIHASSKDIDLIKCAIVVSILSALCFSFNLILGFHSVVAILVRILAIILGSVGGVFTANYLDSKRRRTSRYH